MLQMKHAAEAHDAAAPPIRAERLSASYDGAEALDEMSFQVEVGDQVAVVGPNGAGKTTLFKVLAGILRPSSGQVEIHGHRPGDHVCLAYLPQRSQVDWQFPVTVGDVVMMGRVGSLGFFRWPRRKDWEIVKSALDRVGMGAYADRQIGELSGGQQQRAFLAQAVAQEAEIVLLDEPLSGLDMPSQEAILRILRDLRQDGVTLMVATHDLNLAAEHFDRVMLLNRRMIGYGRPEEVFTRERLAQAYGGNLREVPAGDGSVILADTHHTGRE